MSKLDVVETTISSAVADDGTFTVGYPSGRDGGDYEGGYDHRIVSFTYGDLSVQAGDISIAFGATSATITNRTGGALAANTKFYVQLDRVGTQFTSKLANESKMALLAPVMVNLGEPNTADPNGAVASQACTAASGLATGINGALATSSVATFDRPRNVVAAWTGTAALTVTGTDEYGTVIVESSASGTSLAGKKAFKTVTGVTTSADITGLTVGSGDVLGLPVFIPNAAAIIGEFEDGADATAGTVVGGVVAEATATTGDVRGTYDPNTAMDGSTAIQLLAVLDDPSYKGVTQYGG